MIKEIKYNGYTVTPSDYECEDGDLDMASNLVQEDGALQPILPPLKEFGIGANYRLVFIHKVKPEYQYILYDTENNRLYRTTKAAAVAGTSGYPDQISTEMYPSFNHVDAVGNTLLVFSDTYTSSGTTYAGGIDYYLWKGTTYQRLGNRLPDVSLSFGLFGRPRLFSVSDDSHSKFDVEFAESIPIEDIHNNLSEENKRSVTEQVMGKVNRFIKEQTIDKGRFCFPFLVRYALRLYDGTLACHSAPILMNPSTKAAPIVYADRFNQSTFIPIKVDKALDCDIMLVAANLDYQVIDLDMLSDWSDIVKSVDVFITKPIYTYDQDGKIQSFFDSDNFDTKFIGQLYCDYLVNHDAAPVEDCIFAPLGGGDSRWDFQYHHSEWTYQHIYAMYFDSTRQYPTYTFHMPEFSEEQVSESIKNASAFYKLCSFSNEELSAKDTQRRYILQVEEKYLESLLQREVMTDDYQTHDKLMAGVSYNYNNRLNLAAMSRELYSGYRPESMFAYCDCLMGVTIGTAGSDGTPITLTPAPLSSDYYEVFVYIDEGNEKYRVERTSSIRLVNFFSDSNYRRSWGVYVYYPNGNAYKMVIYNATRGYYEIDMKTHDFLNGAYALLDYELMRTATATPYNPTVSATNIIEMPNKIYTSEVNNPFFFPVTGINTVGTGKVIGISTAAKALSEGQFGQFPLYAFSTEGVWAMEVSDTGTYKTRQPITRDVCINEESITQLDNAVLFATDRGIMILSGSTSTCISDEINDETPFNVSMLPQMGALLTGLGYEVASIATTFRTFLMGCRMIYDYVHQRVVVYNPEYDYSYVFSMKSKHWTTMPSKIIDSIPSYPQAYAVSQGAEDNMLVDLSQDTTDEDALKGIKGVVITRPFKLDYPDALKTINTIIQRGYFDYHNDGTVKKVQQVLYGSRDLFNWYPVFSSQDLYLRGFRGTPYKYFRLALICNLDKDETLVGCTVQYEPRLTNKPR